MTHGSSRNDRWPQFPVLQIAAALGIEVKRNKAMCFAGHDKKTPSLSFHVGRNTWKCFGCGLGGDSIKLVEVVNHLPFPKALKWCESICGVSAAKREHRRTRRVRVPYVVRAKADIHTDAALVYAHLLELCPLTPDGRGYMASRGFSSATCDAFGVSELRDAAAVRSALERRWGWPRLLACGLARAPEEGTNNRPRFLWWDHTILFPFRRGGLIEYVQGRRLDPEPPKYVGLAGVPKPLFNADVLQRAARGSRLLICEGIPDVLAATQKGMSAVGVLGASSFLADWVPLFAHTDVWVVPDRDAAGAKFADSVRRAFAGYGMGVRTFKIDEPYKDLAEFLMSTKTNATGTGRRASRKGK